MPARPNAGSQNLFSWLPRPLRRHLAAIGEAEHMSPRALLVIAARDAVVSG
jgi:hypothetical protein